LNKYDYLPNETVKNIAYEVGAVVPDESSMALILTHYNIIHEESLQEQGLLDEISFENYVEQNNTPTLIELENQDELIELVAAATGIATGKIEIMAYDKPVYEAAEGGSFFDNITNYLMVLLTVLIAALLIFVIIRGTSPVEVTETEPELSVEDLLETTRDDTTALEEIELEDKSETRIMIEKFVDENPEAVALLLRNWINEDWGGV
jgi:flagellar M-ring protein FliF